MQVQVRSEEAFLRPQHLWRSGLRLEVRAKTPIAGHMCSAWMTKAPDTSRSVRHSGALPTALRILASALAWRPAQPADGDGRDRSRSPYRQNEAEAEAEEADAQPNPAHIAQLSSPASSSSSAHTQQTPTLTPAAPETYSQWASQITWLSPNSTAHVINFPRFVFYDCSRCGTHAPGIDFPYCMTCTHPPICRWCMMRLVPSRNTPHAYLCGSWSGCFIDAYDFVAQMLRLPDAPGTRRSAQGFLLEVGSLHDTPTGLSSFQQTQLTLHQALLCIITILMGELFDHRARGQEVSLTIDREWCTEAFQLLSEEHPEAAIAASLPSYVIATRRRVTHLVDLEADQSEAAGDTSEDYEIGEEDQDWDSADEEVMAATEQLNGPAAL